MPIQENCDAVTTANQRNMTPYLGTDLLADIDSVIERDIKIENLPPLSIAPPSPLTENIQQDQPIPFPAILAPSIPPPHPLHADTTVWEKGGCHTSNLIWIHKEGDRYR